MLDESLSLRDEGLSAYHQRHVKQGALGAFLLAVDEGRIPRGSVLVVEGLDRLSRAEPIQAQAQLAQIINGGITVVTASDGREYSREALKAQPMDLVYSLLVMIRAHEESDTKSKRVTASIRRLCEGWKNGTYRGLIRNGRDPEWLHWTGTAWDLVPDRVEAVRRALDLYRQGLGGGRTSKRMHAEGRAMTVAGVAGQQLYRLIRQPALRGAKRISVAGEDYLLEDYYPRLLSDAEYADLQVLASQRHRRRGAGEIPGIITGVGLTYCGYCGSALVAQNLMNRRRPDGTLADGHRRLHCVAYSKEGGCKGSGSCSVVPIERALLNYCADQMNLDRLRAAPDGSSVLRDRLAATRRQIDELARQLERVTDALLADDSGAAPLAFIRRARELEQQQAAATAQARELEYELTASGARIQPAQAERWAELAELVEQDDYEAREQVRQLMLDTFERLVIYMRGIAQDDRKGKTIDLLMVPKGGRPRLLRVDRRTGKWCAGEDFA